MAIAHPNPLEGPTVDHLRGRTSLKWRLHPDDVLPLWVAEMDADPIAPVVTALSAAIASGDTGYPGGWGYAAALGEFASDRWGFEGIAVERTASVPDVMQGAVEMIRLVTEPGDAVVVNCPVYPPFYSFSEHAGRHVVEAPLTDEFRIDLDSLGAAFERARHGGRAAAYLLCSPHNPTGTVHTADELTAVAALADRMGVRVIVDEIHAPLVLPGARFTPFLSVPGGERGLVLFSASKAWNLAGVKAGLAIAGTESAADLARIPEVVSHGASHLGDIAHTVALREGGDWLDALLLGLDANRSLLDGLLAEHLPGARWLPPQGTYLAWLDCRDLDLPASALAEGSGRGDPLSLDGPAGFFLEHARVALSAGPAFGTGGRGHVRLNFATSGVVLTEALCRMGAAVG